MKSLVQKLKNGGKNIKKSKSISRFAKQKNNGETRKTIKHLNKRESIGWINKIKQVMLNHINVNIKEYAIVSIFFLIGVILGVIVINNSDIETRNNIQGYIQTFINSLKSSEYKIDMEELLKSSMINNTKLVLLIWFIGSTVIGMPLIYGIIAFRGYCLGYTIAAIIATLGSGNGITFALASMLLQNLLVIPGIFALGISREKIIQSNYAR